LPFISIRRIAFCNISALNSIRTNPAEPLIKSSIAPPFIEKERVEYYLYIKNDRERSHSRPCAALGFAGGFARRMCGNALLSTVFLNIILATIENRLFLKHRPKFNSFRRTFSNPTESSTKLTQSATDDSLFFNGFFQ
jgi:hypothetical protein